jgi:hypothetical protein
LAPPPWWRLRRGYPWMSRARFRGRARPPWAVWLLWRCRHRRRRRTLELWQAGDRVCWLLRDCKSSRLRSQFGVWATRLEADTLVRPAIRFPAARGRAPGCRQCRLRHLCRKQAIQVQVNGRARFPVRGLVPHQAWRRLLRLVPEATPTTAGAKSR